MSARVIVQVVEIGEDGSGTSEAWTFHPEAYAALVRRFTRLFGRPPMHSAVATAEALNTGIAATQQGMVVVDHE